MLQVKLEAADHSFQLLIRNGCSDPGKECGRRSTWSLGTGPSTASPSHSPASARQRGPQKVPAGDLSSEGTAEAWSGCVQRSETAKRWRHRH